MKKEFKEMLKERGRTEMPNVLLVSAECAPLSKTGGLADVVGTLPKALKKLGIDARVITPYHRCIKNKYADQVEHMFHFYSRLGWRNAYVGLEKLELDGVTIYLIDNEQYFGDKIYRGGNAEGEQYSFFCRAVLDVLPNLDFQVDVCHCNDWHTAIMPMLAHTQYRGWMQDKVKYLLTIHNIKFQGQYGFEFVQDLLEIDRSYYISDYLEQDGCANYMTAGCVFADRINTVSPSYAWEIKTPEYSEGLEGILNARSAQLTGIINGMSEFRSYGHLASKERRMTPSAVLEEYNSRPADYDEAARVAMKCIAESHAMTSKMVGTLYFALVHDVGVGKARAEQFFEQINSFDTAENAAVEKMRRWNLANKDKRISDKLRVAYVIRSWNAFVDGGKVPRFSEHDADIMPVFKKNG